MSPDGAEEDEKRAFCRRKRPEISKCKMKSRHLAQRARASLSDVEYFSSLLGPNESQLALNTAKAMIDRIWGLRFTPSLGYSVTGL
jgi:hypothetical protein